MLEILLYRPHKSQKWVSLVLLIITVVVFILAAIVSWFPLALIASWLLWCAWSIYTDYSKVIAFGTTEIQTLGHKSEKRCLWSQFNNAYLGANFKGFYFMILSPTELNENEVRRLCNKASLSSNFFGHGDTFVFFVDKKVKDEIIEIVKTKLPLKDFNSMYEG